MPAPRNYVRGYSFAGYQATNPNRPLPGPSLDNELEEIEQSLTEAISGLNDIRRADGQLRNGIVGRDALAPDLSTGVRPATLWQAGIQYQKQDTVSYLASFYRCTIDHLSTDFLTDLTATRWELYADIGTTATDAQIARNEAVAARNEAVPAGAAATAGSNNVTALYDLFDDRYLGEKTALPTLDNDGNALVDGALVSLTGQAPATLNGMYVRRGGAWQSVLSQFLGAFVAYRYVATAAQTVLTGTDANGFTLSYVPNAVLVTVNGASLAPNNYTATNGTSITLGAALTAGDVVVVNSFGSFSVASADARLDRLVTRRVSVADYAGADPTGATVSTSAFQAAAAAAVANNADLIIPEGRWVTDAPVNIDMTALGFNDRNRPNVIGAGRGRTTWEYIGPSGTAALNIIGPAWANVANVRQRISGFRLRGMDPLPATNRLGIALTRCLKIAFQDVEVLEFNQGVFLTDCVHLSFYDCGISFNNYGLNSVRSPVYGINDDGSPGNIMVFNKCDFLANRQYGARFQDSANIVFVGGSFEGNGRTGGWISDATRYGVGIFDAGYNGAAGLMMYGTHFETSGGTTDVFISHSDHPCIYIFDGVDFVRNGTVQFPTHNIYFTSTGATKSKLIVRGGFRGVNGYVPSAARRYIAQVGTLTNHVLDDEGSVYESSTELPFYSGRQHGYPSHAHAFVLALPDATIFQASNIASVVKNATGDYTVTFSIACQSANFAVVPALVAGPQQMILVSRTTTTVRVNFRNYLAALEDPAFEWGLVVFDA
jgi:hypothetical protein